MRIKPAISCANTYKFSLIAEKDWMTRLAISGSAVAPYLISICFYFVYSLENESQLIRFSVAFGTKIFRTLEEKTPKMWHKCGINRKKKSRTK